MRRIVNDDWTIGVAATTLLLSATNHLPNRGVGMDGYNIYPDLALNGKTPWPLVASSLWLRLGFVAATGVVVALTELYKGELDLLAALAWIFGGAWLAALSWRRAMVLIDRLDGVEAATEYAPSEVTAPGATAYPSWDRREVNAPQVRG
jgi:hypothetical protein